MKRILNFFRPKVDTIFLTNELKSELKNIKREIREEFSQELKTKLQAIDKFCEIQCTQCNKLIVTYPLGGGYYREFNGAVICSNKCLDKRKSLKNE